MYGIMVSVDGGEPKWYTYTGRRPELFDSPEEAKGYVRCMRQQHDEPFRGPDKKYNVEKFKESASRNQLFEQALAASRNS